MSMSPIVFYLRVTLGLFRGHVYVDFLLADFFKYIRNSNKQLLGYTINFNKCLLRPGALRFPTIWGKFKFPDFSRVKPTCSTFILN
jgi:hypothetical protein